MFVGCGKGYAGTGAIGAVAFSFSQSFSGPGALARKSHTDDMGIVSVGNLGTGLGLNRSHTDDIGIVSVGESRV